MIAEYKSNGDTMNNVRYETSRTFSNRNREYKRTKCMNLKQVVKKKFINRLGWRHK
jgi:hypothetical protein